MIEFLDDNQRAQMNDPAVSANFVGLRYVADQMPGITRERAGQSFRFRYPTGEIVLEPAVLKRIKALAIPPAWTDVWVCPDPCGHLQATGRDARRRKQFRYHARWREIRDETKYARMLAFGKALPRIRRRVEHDLSLPGLVREKVLAAVVRLLELSLIRVGNEEYAKENDSFGLTTMRDRHVDIEGSRLRFHFRGKSGKWHEVDIRDRRLAKIVKNCQELPGQELFQYVDADSARQKVSSEDVNAYLHEIAGEEFTAKDFRTWAGTVLAAMALREFSIHSPIHSSPSQTQVKKNVVAAVASVAKRLGNTVAVCRKCYIHPEVIGAYMDGTLAKRIPHSSPHPLIHSSSSALGPEEAAVLALLQRRLTNQNDLCGTWKAPSGKRARKR